MSYLCAGFVGRAIVRLCENLGISPWWVIGGFGVLIVVSKIRGR